MQFYLGTFDESADSAMLRMGLPCFRMDINDARNSKCTEKLICVTLPLATVCGFFRKSCADACFFEVKSPVWNVDRQHWIHAFCAVNSENSLPMEVVVDEVYTYSM